MYNLCVRNCAVLHKMLYLCSVIEKRESEKVKR